MNDQHEHERFEQDVGPYLLGALPRAELREFERHLLGCKRCRREVDTLRAAVDILPESVEQVDPPPALRERVMAEVHGDVAVKKSRPKRARRFKLNFRPAVALGVVGAVCVGAVLGFVVGSDRDEGPSTTTVVAQAGAGAPRAQADVIVAGDSGTIDISRLPVLGEGRVYQVWIQHGDKVTPSSLFVVNHNGKGAAAIPHGLNGADQVMVTSEPDGGSAVPSSKPVLRASVS